MSDRDIDIVRAFCDAWASHDLDRIMSFLAPDCEWENVPIEVLSGKPAIGAKLEKVLAGATRFEWFLLDIARSASGAVLTERLDRIEIGEKRIDVRLMGIFHMRDGLITLWRDYFDLGQYLRQMGERKW